MNKVKKYKIIYVGGAIDHIVMPIILELHKIYGDDFLFISTYEKPGLRVGIGYDYSNFDYEFIRKSYISKSEFKECKKLIKNSKIVIYQTVKDRAILRPRLFSSKITFKCTERFFKTKTTYKNFLHRVLGTIYHYHLFNKHNKYVLCMGGYVAQDLKKAHLFKNKMLTWGYFTETTKLTFDELLSLKNKNEKLLFCWVGRFVNEKQPIMVLKLAQFLKKKKINFEIKMGGYGPLEEECKKYIFDNDLEDCVQIVGALTLKEKENLMNKSNCFLFTSTNEEGWGAVLNEAMGSGCVCFASKETGSSKTLINDKNNGFLFSCMDQSELNELVYKYILDPDATVSKNAYESIHLYWNAKVACKNLSRFINNILECDKIDFEQYGPCSRAF